MAGMIGGVAAGMLGGALSNQKEGGKTAGNAYNLSPEDQDALRRTQRQSIDAQQVYGQDPTKNVQNNAILGGMFGKGGTFDRTNAEEQRLSNQGFELTPEDHTAYGQASGNIARMFGENDQSLAQALSDRGLSNSGVAGQAFSNSLGNKNEQLAGLQTQIAQKRMEMNNQRLGQTRNFLSQLGQQANTDINSEHDRGMQDTNQYNDVLRNRFDMAGNMMGNFQHQANEGLKQEQQTEHGSNLSNALNGGIQGGMTAAKMSGGGAAPGGTKMAGSSYSNGGMFA